MNRVACMRYLLYCTMSLRPLLSRPLITEKEELARDLITAGNMAKYLATLQKVGSGGCADDVCLWVWVWVFWQWFLRIIFCSPFFILSAQAI